jgi:hypothetical protein
VGQVDPHYREGIPGKKNTKTARYFAIVSNRGNLLIHAEYGIIHYWKKNSKSEINETHAQPKET